MNSFNKSVKILNILGNEQCKSFWSGVVDFFIGETYESELVELGLKRTGFECLSFLSSIKGIIKLVISFP